MFSEVHDVRRAARRLVRELNLLDDGLCCAGFSYSECHLLTELEIMGQATASELGERLVLEKSTMSRLVNSLIGRGLVEFRDDPADRRRRMLNLTVAGREANCSINQIANQQVQSALGLVTPADREVVVDGLNRYSKALRYARLGEAFTLRPIKVADNPAVARIIGQVMAEFGVSGCGYSSEDAEIDDMASAYAQKRAAYFVVCRSSQIMGCGGMGPLNGGANEVCEIRKMYLLPESRGCGLGVRLLETVLSAARSANFQTCYLETLESMSHARQLYLKFGFRPIAEAMGQTGHSACNQYMSLPLRPAV